MTVDIHVNAPARLPPHLNPSITTRKMMIGAPANSQETILMSITNKDYT